MLYSIEILKRSDLMELFDLEQLAAFKTYGTLSLAAQKLHLSQPTLTKTMKRLEEEFKVPLFVRTKNKLCLNENGELAVIHAQRILNDTENMIQMVRAFDHSRRTITIGTSSMIPAAKLVRQLGNLYPDMTIASEQKDFDDLSTGFLDDTYQYIILPYIPEELSEFHVEILMEEHLYFNLPKNHPLADRKSLSLTDINGQNMIVMPDIGFWKDIIDEKMPDSRFLKQTDKEAFEDLLEASVLPSFTSDQAMKEFIQPEDRIPIPITDPEVNITFYAISKRA